MLKHSLTYQCWSINTLRLRQNGHHFPDGIFKSTFLNETVWILMIISTKIVPKGPINNIPALVQIMAWHQSADKPLSEPMMASVTAAYICITRPQWVSHSPLMWLTKAPVLTFAPLCPKFNIYSLLWIINIAALISTPHVTYQCDSFNLCSLLWLTINLPSFGDLPIWQH